MGWVRDKDGFWLADDKSGNKVSDIGNFIGAGGEIFHVQNVGRILAHCNEMKKDGGWSKDRTMKRYASIPFVEYIKHPGLSEDDKELAAFIESHPQYRTSTETHGTAVRNIVVK